VHPAKKNVLTHVRSSLLEEPKGIWLTQVRLKDDC